MFLSNLYINVIYSSVVMKRKVLKNSKLLTDSILTSLEVFCWMIAIWLFSCAKNRFNYILVSRDHITLPSIFLTSRVISSFSVSMRYLNSCLNDRISLKAALVAMNDCKAGSDIFVFVSSHQK